MSYREEIEEDDDPLGLDCVERNTEKALTALQIQISSHRMLAT